MNNCFYRIIFLFLGRLATVPYYSFFSLFIGDFIDVITFALASFFGMFAILTILFYMERLYVVILNKINSKKQPIKKIKEIKKK